MPEKPKSQADTRRAQTIPDQFGRYYTVSIDIKIGEPTGAILNTGWDDPLMTPRHLFKFKQGSLGQPMFEVKLVQWLDEQRQSQREWDRRFSFYKRHMPRTATDAEIAQESGESPWPPVKALEMAVSGSKGLLGLEPLSKKELEALELTADEAVARGLKVEPEKSAKGPKPVAVGA